MQYSDLEQFSIIIIILDFVNPVLVYTASQGTVLQSRITELAG